MGCLMKPATTPAHLISRLPVQTKLETNAINLEAEHARIKYAYWVEAVLIEFNHGKSGLPAVAGVPMTLPVGDDGLALII